MSLTWFATTLQATVCSGNGDISGEYAFIASRTMFAAGLTGYPGLTSSTGTSGSLFPGETSRGIRGLVVRAALGVPYNISGTVWADGSGAFYVFPGVNLNALGLTTGQLSMLPAQIKVGTYTVNGDCTVMMSFDTTTLESMLTALSSTSGSSTGSGSSSGTGSGSSSGSGSGMSSGSSGTGSGSGSGMGSGSSSGTGSGSSTGSSSGTGSSTTSTTTATFEGVLVERTNEIQLVQTDNVGGSDLALVHTISTAGTCTNSSFMGSFGVVSKLAVLNLSGAASGSSGTGGTASGSSSGSSTVSVFPNVNLFPVIGQLNADGNGNFVLLANSAHSAGFNEITGTYTVYPDCAGIATLMIGSPTAAASGSSSSGSSSSSSGSSGSTSGTTTIVPGQAGSTLTIEFVIGRELAPAPSTGFLPVLDYVFTGHGMGGGGTAKPE
jgi:hypothetical protein